MNLWRRQNVRINFKRILGEIHCECEWGVAVLWQDIRVMTIMGIIIIITTTNCNWVCHSVAVALTLVQTKQTGINIRKRNNTKNTVQTIQNTINTSARITNIPIHYKTHIICPDNSFSFPGYILNIVFSYYDTALFGWWVPTASVFTWCVRKVGIRVRD
jgi:hypothetical protein